MVDVSITLDRGTRELRTELVARDPVTGWLPDDWAVGLLPPNDATGRGEGHISYIVEPVSGLPSGTRIENEARIIFDWNEPIDTPMVVNTIDAGVPASTVNPLPATVNTTDFGITWNGADGPGESGVADYDVYVSENGGPFQKWLGRTTGLQATFSGEGSHPYAFYTRARDNAGNLEPAPLVSDTTVTVFAPADFDSDGSVDGGDLGIWQGGFGTASGADLSNGDADGDGDVDGNDFLSWQVHCDGNALQLPNADFNSDGSVDGVDLGIWEGGYGIPGGAVLSDGDANTDEDVDGSDFLSWQLSFGSVVVPGTGADFNSDGTVDGSDLNLWQNGFGVKVVADLSDGDSDGDRDDQVRCKYPAR